MRRGTPVCRESVRRRGISKVDPVGINGSASRDVPTTASRAGYPILRGRRKQSRTMSSESRPLSMSWLGSITPLAKLFSEQGRFDEAYARVQQLKSHSVNNTHNLSSGAERKVWRVSFAFGRASHIVGREGSDRYKNGSMGGYNHRPLRVEETGSDKWIRE